jgi:hypothetical protein
MKLRYALLKPTLKYRLCSGSRKPMASVDPVACVRARETVHTYGDTQFGAQVQARVVYILVLVTPDHCISLPLRVVCWLRRHRI